MQNYKAKCCHAFTLQAAIFNNLLNLEKEYFFSKNLLVESINKGASKDFFEINNEIIYQNV